MPHERRVWQKMSQAEEALWTRLRQQIQKQIDRRTLAGNIILQVAKQAFVMQVEAGRNADQESIQIKGIQAKSFSQNLEARLFAAGMGGFRQLPYLLFSAGNGRDKRGFFFRIGLNQVAPISAEWAGAENARFRVRNIQPAKGIAGILACLLPAVHLAADQHTDLTQGGLQILEISNTCVASASIVGLLVNSACRHAAIHLMMLPLPLWARLMT
jgi:hypothetical protein